MTTVSTTTPAASAGSAPGATALGSLTSNFSDFLKLLMTQLKNQDPTSPMDANQFTTELVQFSGVEQQINMNTSLNQLIQLTQTAGITQSSAILGKQVTVQSSQIALQDGSGALNFTAPVPENVSISIQDANGRALRQVTLKASQGANTWSWDGKNNAGQTVPDGAYTVAVTGGPSGAAAAALPFTVTGVASGVTVLNNTVNLRLGALTVPFSAVRSVGN
ncbi:MAG: flagellar hook assembly protein FlgD [Acetobacteraceae bacterium]|nr:flagellar hook assembly protein FlgD [Acetobacteraceae bacterium]